MKLEDHLDMAPMSIHDHPYKLAPILNTDPPRQRFAPIEPEVSASNAHPPPIPLQINSKGHTYAAQSEPTCPPLAPTVRSAANNDHEIKQILEDTYSESGQSVTQSLSSSSQATTPPPLDRKESAKIKHNKNQTEKRLENQIWLENVEMRLVRCLRASGIDPDQDASHRFAFTAALDDPGTQNAKQHWLRRQYDEGSLSMATVAIFERFAELLEEEADSIKLDDATLARHWKRMKSVLHQQPKPFDRESRLPPTQFEEKDRNAPYYFEYTPSSNEGKDERKRYFEKHPTESPRDQIVGVSTKRRRNGGSNSATKARKR